MEQDVIDNNLPATIIDDAGFQSLVNAWKFADIWDQFDVIYDGKPDVPARLHGFTIVRSNNPQEPYGVLLQMCPKQAKTDDGPQYMGKKLLAKVRLN